MGICKSALAFFQKLVYDGFNDAGTKDKSNAFALVLAAREGAFGVFFTTGRTNGGRAVCIDLTDSNKHLLLSNFWS